MNDTINLTRVLCPVFVQAAEALVRDAYPRNLTLDKSAELASYACRYGKIVDVTLKQSLYGAYSKWIAFAFGLVGSILALITFSRKEYSTCVTMIYHRSINGIEIINALIILQSALQSFYGDRLLKYQSWAYLDVLVVEKLRNCLLFWVNLIVLWIAFERVLACLFSTRFEMINRKTVAAFVIAAAGIASTFVFLPYGFTLDYAYDNTTQSYKIVASNWSKSADGGYPIYTLSLSILMICHSTLLFASSISALIGLISMTKRKKALANASKKSKSSKELLKQCSLNIQLCVLQMCETVPCIANQLLFVYLTVRYSYVAPFQTTNLAVAPRLMTYAQALIFTDAITIYLWLGFVNGIGVLISHFARFYWYLIFSPRVRRSFWASLSRRNRVGATTTCMPTEQKVTKITVKPASHIVSAC